ncbi:hypothetical protein BDZ97DRAFT_1696290 [Flammula alnicola]|nr:hypothetical protein BDZ97DRAFT_1696290 [Flammula alnicola]
MLTQCITGAFLFGVGDVVAQQGIEGKGREHDFSRTARLTLYRGALFGPAMTKWYQFLNQIQTPRRTTALIYRVSLDQAIFSPAAVASFYGTMSALEGRPSEAADRVRATFVPTLLLSWVVYIPTQIINLSLTPPHLRVVVVSMASVFWNTYLSASNARHEVTGRDGLATVSTHSSRAENPA